MGKETSESIASYKDLSLVIGQFVGRDNVVVLHRSLIRFCKDEIPTAIVLAQLIYWHDKGEIKGRFYKSYKEWQQETGLSVYSVKRAIEHLGEFASTEIHRANGAPTVHYYFKMDEFSESFLKFLTMDNEKFNNGKLKISQSLTKITTKPTTKNTLSKAKRYGEFENVLLTDKEYNKLTDKFGVDGALKRVAKLSEGIASKGYKYKSHYATILSWERKDFMRGKNGKGSKNSREIPKEYTEAPTY